MQLWKILGGLVVGLAASVASAQDTVAYHINDTAEQALGGLRNMTWIRARR